MEEMSRLKALEVLGISSEMLEDDKAKILGSLGVKAWGNSSSSTGVDRDQNAGSTCNLFSKRRHTASEASGIPAPMCGMAAPAPRQVTSCQLRKFLRAGTLIDSYRIWGDHRLMIHVTRIQPIFLPPESRVGGGFHRLRLPTVTLT